MLGLLGGMKAHENLLFQVVNLRIYQLNGPCPDTVQTLARRCGIRARSAEVAITSLIENGYLKRIKRGIIIPSAMKTVAEAKKKYERKIKATQKGGIERARNARSNQRQKSAAAQLKLTHRQSHYTSDFLESGDDLSITTEERTELLSLCRKVLGDGSDGFSGLFINSPIGDFENKKQILGRAAQKAHPDAYIRRILERQR